MIKIRLVEAKGCPTIWLNEKVSNPADSRLKFCYKMSSLLPRWNHALQCASVEPSWTISTNGETVTMWQNWANRDHSTGCDVREQCRTWSLHIYEYNNATEAWRPSHWEQDERQFSKENWPDMSLSCEKPFKNSKSENARKIPGSSCRCSKIMQVNQYSAQLEFVISLKCQTHYILCFLLRQLKVSCFWSSPMNWCWCRLSSWEKERQIDCFFVMYGGWQ